MSKSSGTFYSILIFAISLILLGAAYWIAIFMVSYSIYALFAFGVGVFLLAVACGMTPGRDDNIPKKDVSKKA